MNKDDIPREELYTVGEIRTISGKYVNVLNPNPDDIVIEDIAHSLAFMPRYGGHTHRFYSVAEHCIRCFYLADPEFKFETLMHDATEAYLLDMMKPIKEVLRDYQALEDNLQKVICEKFGLPYPMSKEVKEIDKAMLEMEWKHVVLRRGGFNRDYSSIQAKEEFLRLFIESCPEACLSQLK